MPMFALERIRVIKKYLTEHEQAEVQALSSLLSVSEVTVRRDLMKLEHEGFLTRTHGGAMINPPEEQSEPSPIAPVDGETGRRFSELAAIGIRMVQDGDFVMLIDGEVNARIAERLEEKSDVTVLTNDVRIASVVSRQPRNRVVLLGGDMDPGGSAAYGSMTIENVRRFHVERLFIEVDGITPALQLTVAEQRKADFISAAVEHAERSIIVCPADRVGRSAFYRFAGIRLADTVITNPSLSDEYKSRIFAEDVALFTAIDVFEGTV